MFEVKPRAVDKKESSTETDEGLGSSRGRCSSGSAGSGSIYLSDSQDWAVSPDEPPSHNPAISPLLAEETFRYMTYLALEPSSYSHPGSQSYSTVLSADRVEQMTKTYNDIDVVTHLLAERDRDLELAARIGQSLLQRNHLLQQRNEAIEEQLAQVLDQVHQLQHELSKKDELLRMVASASEESETDSSCSTPHRQPQPQGGGVTAASALSQLEALQGKLQELEEENLSLRSEACHLKHETVTYEEKEQQLVSDCVKELRESNSQMVSLTDELSQKNEELMRHQEEIAQLLSQIVELQHRVKELALEKEELRIHLQASKEAQRQLTAELNELTETNAECVGMLHESQEEIKELRSRSAPSAGMRRHLSYGLYPMDSLAAEIEGTMRRELSVEEETAVEDQRVSQKRVFQTVRSVNTLVGRAPAVHAVPPIPGSGCSSLVMTAQPFQSAQGMLCFCSSREEVQLGRPGSPGGGDLNDALHRLSLRRHNFLCERQFFRAERERKLQALAGAEPECVSPAGSALSSSSSSSLPELSLSCSAFRTFLPEKLQIVKPMEGSLTLHHWQQLAQPHLGTILDPHPGVVTKGFRPLPQDAVYRLTDLEEDEEEGGRLRGVREKGAAEGGEGKEDGEKGAAEGGEGEEDGEEMGGITFKVRYSSTPEDKQRKRPATPTSPHLQTLKPSYPLTSSSSSLTTSSCSLTPSSYSSSSFSLTNGAPSPLAQSVAPSQSERPSASATSTAPSFSAHNPGKCQSATSSTYTFTTCRILHPSDITTVTSSSGPQASASANTPSSLRTGPSTPVTPCRLSLGDCFPPRRAAPGGLAQLVLERGISSVAPPEQQPLFHLLPGTPPNSPAGLAPPAVSAAAPASDNFLASRPAELFLQDVYGLNLGRAPHPRLPSPSRDSPAGGSLVDRLCRLGFSSRLQGSEAPPPRPHNPPSSSSSTFVATGGGSLLDGLRRNQSLPAMIGARSASRRALPSPPSHPTSLALPPTPWGNPRGQRRRPASLPHPPSSGVNTTRS